MDYAPATFICWVASNEPLEEMVNDAKALTWELGVEHAVIELQNGRKALVRGGRLGIKFTVMKDKFADPFGQRKQRLTLKVADEDIAIDKLIFHTHLLVTGPSRFDQDILDLLDQDESWIYEIGDPAGTLFTRKSRAIGGPNS